MALDSSHTHSLSYFVIFELVSDIAFNNFSKIKRVYNFNYMLSLFFTVNSVILRIGNNRKTNREYHLRIRCTNTC